MEYRQGEKAKGERNKGNERIKKEIVIFHMKIINFTIMY